MAQITNQQAFDLALQHFQAGRLGEAERLCRAILAQSADDVDATHCLAVIAYQMRRLDEAIDLFRRTIALEPDFAEARNALGIVLKDDGQLDAAVATFREAIATAPDYAEAYHNLSIALRAAGQIDDAIAASRRAINLVPTMAQAHTCLGMCLKDKGMLEDAIACFRQAIALRPDSAENYCSLGWALVENRQFDQAIAACRQSIALNPDSPDAHRNLGISLQKNGQKDDAIAAFQQAIALAPNHAGAHGNLGALLREKGRLDEAIAAFRRAITIERENADSHYNLGNVLRDTGQLEDALAAYRQAISLRPDHAKAHSNLATVFKDIGHLDQAISFFRRAMECAPGDAGFHSNLVYTLLFHPAYDANAIYEEASRWNQRHAVPLSTLLATIGEDSGKALSKGTAPARSDDPTPDRRLRIGYVSPDFLDHCQSLFTIPLLSHHDHGAFEIFCYSSVERPDEYTRRIAGYADTWREVRALDDAAVCDLIREDRIDILVDLTMHMANGRSLVFARKPAPIQIAWLAYPGTTGLTAIDYRLSDPFLDPLGMDESVYSEKTLRLPDSFWCYDPLQGRQVPVSPLPALASGSITFGCLGNFCKINDVILKLWARVMHQTPDARLMLLAPFGNHPQWALDRLEQEGIDPQRIEFVAPRPRRQYLEFYHRIDIGLDSFPYNGHTTSLDSMWMGVPVVTLVGQMPVSRAGWCQLSNLGLRELAGHTPDQFVQIAVDLANDLPRLQALRSTLRQRMERSPLMDAPKFARGIEAAYRQMWRSML